MIGNLHQSALCSWTTLCLVVAIIFSTQSSALASYKVILKDGTVVEAMSKPVSMDDQYLIRTIDNKIYSVPLYQVNLAATEVANQPTQSKMQITPSQPATTISQTPPVLSSLTNNDVLDMHKMGLSSEIIMAKIKSSTCRFDTSLPALQELKASGVPGSIILAMVQPSPPAQPSQQAASVVPTAASDPARASLPAPKVEQSPPTQDQRPTPGKIRVFITDSQSWEMRSAIGGNSNGFAGESSGGARPQTAEIIKTFGERCPGSTVTMKKEKADYIVVLDHEGGKALARRDNKVAVFNKEGDSVYSGSTRSLGSSVKDACEAIMKDARP